MYGPACFHCPIRFKSKLKREGKWSISDERTLIDNVIFNKYKFGEISILVSHPQISNFLELEELCQEAIISFPYEQLNFESTNTTYVELRDKTVAQFQYIRLKEILKKIIGTELWIEIPNGHSDEDLCKKTVYPYSH